MKSTNTRLTANFLPLSLRKKTIISKVAILSTLAALTLSVQAQYTNVTVSNSLKVETSSSTGNHLEMRSNGILIGKTDGSTASLLSSDFGHEGFLWHPGLKSLFVGTSFDDSNTGAHSVTFYNSFCVGEGALALPSSFGNLAGDFSLAGGLGSSAIGASSFAFSFGVATGDYSTALGWSTADGELSTSLGQSSANSYESLTIGRFNSGLGSPGSWVATDPVFEIGNGQSASALSNAMTVYKNGRMNLAGKLSIFNGNVATPTIVIDPVTADIKINNQSVLRATSSGYLGIGMTNPQHLLDLGNAYIEQDGSAGFNGQITANADAGGRFDVAGAGGEIIFQVSGSGGEMTSIDNNGTERIIMNSNGYSLYSEHGFPTLTLSSNDGSASFQGGNVTIDDTRVMLWDRTLTSIGGAGVELVKLSSDYSGTGDIANSFSFVDGLTSLTASKISGIDYGESTGGLVFNVGEEAGIQAMKIDSAGNVGIGNASPTAKLDVNGGARFQGVVHVAKGGDIPMFVP